MSGLKSRLFASLVAGALLAGCGATSSAPAPASSAKPAKAPSSSAKPAAAPAPAKASRKLTHIVFQLPFYMSGEDAPFVLAQQRGYYAQEGLKIDIKQGRGSSTTAAEVAAGTAPIGFADAGTTAIVASKGGPVVVVAGIFPKTPLGFIFFPSHPVTTLAALKGRTFVAGASSAAFQLLPAVLGKGGLTVSDIKKDAVAPAAQPGFFKSHPEDIVLGNNNSTYIKIHSVVPSSKYRSFADFGVNPYGLSLITNRNEIKNHPNIVRGFVAASIKGWKAALADPQAAVAATVKAYPTQKAKIVMAGLKASFTLLHTPGTKGHPLGWMSKSGWQKTVAIMHKYSGLKHVQAISHYYTDQFVPNS